MSVETTETPVATANSTDTSETNVDTTSDTGGTDAGGEQASAPELQKPAEEPKKDPMGPRFAALTKKEKALVERDQALKTKEQELAKRETDLLHLAKAKQAAETGDYDAVLEHLGAMQDDDSLAKFMKGVNGVVLRKKDLPPEVIEVQRKLRAMEQEKAEKEKAEKDAADKKKKDDDEAAQQRQLQMKNLWLENEAAPYIKKNAETLEVLAYSLEQDNSRERVLEAIFDKIATEKAATEKAGKKFTDDDIPKALAKAAQEVEDDLVKLFGAEIANLSALNKLKPKQEKKEPQTRAEMHEAALKQIDPGQTASPRPRTLTTSVQQAPVRDEAETSDPAVAFQRALKLL